jgi:TonB-linked SusC/RagA family outer membrane protein
MDVLNRWRAALIQVSLTGLLLVAAVGPIAAQTTGSIRGKVTAANTMRPLAGAQVSIPGTGLGTLTNSAGEFLIVDVPVGPQSVRVQMLGFGSAEESVTVADGQAVTVDFQLAESAIALDEIVVTGTPGATQKRAIGNAIAIVDAAELTEAAPVADVQELLTARTPGLNLMSNSGAAGSSSKIRIRGAGSLSGRLEPVIYVDGVRVNSGTQAGYDASWGGAQGTNALDAINPNDIESIEVIKGPAASTLYGADAAAGVIQIITKKGRAGEGVRWNAEYEMGQQDWHLATPLNYTLCEPSHIAKPDRYPGCAGMDPNAPGEQRLLTDNPLRETYECKWTDECQPNPLRTGDIRSFNLSASGGGEGYSFYLSGERGTENGVFYNNFANRTSGRANFGFVPSEKLKLDVNMGYARTHVQMPLNNNASDGILRNAFRGRPGYLARWEEGFYGVSPEISNQYDNQTWTERTTLGLRATYNPFSWFTNRLTFGLDKDDRLYQEFYRIDETGRAPWGTDDAQGSIARKLPSIHVWTAEYAGTINNKLTPEITSAFSVGGQLNAYRYGAHEVIGEGIVANKLNMVGSAATTRADQEMEEQNSLGFFVQEQVGWKDRLFVTGAVRVDDNSAFGENFSLVVYPKASVSYVISDEPYFSVPAVDQLKLRAAWGRAGNAPEPFSADRTLAPDIAIMADVPANQLSFESYGNPDLRAETGEEIELGFDASLLEGRVGVDVTYYNQHTKDALVTIPDPPSSGYSQTHLINIGEIANRGLEVLLTATPVAQSNLVWDATLAVTANRNELVSFNGAREEIAFGGFGFVQKHKKGYPLGGYWAVDVKRDEAGNPILDDDGDAIVDWDNEMYMGPVLPTREVGLTNTLTLFGNLRLFANLDYKGGNYQACAICSIRNRINRNTLQVNDPNASEAEKAVWLSRQTLTHTVPADFVKLRELSATYTLPESWVARFGGRTAALTVSGRNLWMWSEYDERTDMTDPEVTFDSTSLFENFDYASMPMLRRLLVSMRVSF